MSERGDIPREFVPNQDLVNELWRVADPELRGDTDPEKVGNEFFTAWLDFLGIPKKRIALKRGEWQTHRVWLVEPPPDNERKTGQIPGRDFIDFEFRFSTDLETKVDVRIKILNSERYEMPDWAKGIAKRHVFVPDKKYVTKLLTEVEDRRIEAEKQAEKLREERKELLRTILKQIGYEQKIPAERNALLRQYVRKFDYSDDPRGFEILFLDHGEDVLVKIFKDGGVYDILEFSKSN